MMQDAVTAGLLLKWPLEVRLDVVIETATATCLEALDGEDRATARSVAANSRRARRAQRYEPDSVRTRTSRSGMSR